MKEEPYRERENRGFNEQQSANFKRSFNHLKQRGNFYVTSVFQPMVAQL